MTDEKKSYFKFRTPAQIQDMNCRDVRTARGLAAALLGLNFQRDSLRLRFLLTPRRFGLDDPAWASRKDMRHGGYLKLEQPYSIKAALATKEIPLAIRNRALEKLSRVPEAGNFYIGYSYSPITGSDQTRVLVSFWGIGEGERRDGYDQKVCRNLPAHMKAGSTIESYVKSRRVAVEGGTLIVKVPPSTKGAKKRKVKWKHVAVVDCPEKRFVCWNTVPVSDPELVHKSYDIGFKRKESREGSDFRSIHPQDAHAYRVGIRHFWRKNNLVPFERSQVAVLSREGARAWDLLCNNVVIVDPRKKGRRVRDRTRWLHKDEKCILFARVVGFLGDPKKTMFWDAEEDGRIADYDWGNWDAKGR